MKELENKIRETLPRLKSLTDGAIVYRPHWNVFKQEYDEGVYDELELRNGHLFEDDEKVDSYPFCIGDDWYIGHPIKLNDVLEYIKLKSNFKELFYYFCSVDQSENNESDDTFESNFRDYKNIFKDLYYDDEEGYHPDYNGDILYKSIVKTEIFEVEGGYNHKFVIEPNDFILRNWDLSSVFLADQSEELKEFLNSL